MGQLETFAALLRALKERGARFVRLRRDAAATGSHGAAGMRGRAHDAARARRMDLRAGPGAPRTAVSGGSGCAGYKAGAISW